MKSSRILSILLPCCLLANVSLLGQPFPLHFGFDSPPTFDPQYFTTYPNYSGQNGVVDISNGDGALGTAYFVRLGKVNDQAGATVNALDLNLDLSGYENAQLEFSFWFRFFNDDTQYNDGVFMSDDGGGNFTRVIALEPENWCNNAWGAFQTFDLDRLLEQFNLDYTSNFIIQFRHEGIYDWNDTFGNSDGLLLDEIYIGETPTVEPFPISPTEPFYEGFSSGLFEEYWTLKYAEVGAQEKVSEGTTPNGSVHISNSNAVDGDNYCLFLGKWADGCAIGNWQWNWSWADMHLNLSGLEDKDLDFSFWFKYLNEEDQFQDGVWFSDDGGQTFTNIPVISLQPDSWANFLYGKFQTFDLDSLIEKHQLSFSEDFVIRFWQVGIHDWNDTFGNADGLFIDAINIEVASPITYKSIPFCDDFEVDSIFEKHWRYGYAELDDDGMAMPGTTPSAYTGSYPWGAGNRALIAGKFNDSNGETLSKLDLHLNLAFTDSVVLSFDYADYYNEPQAEEGIWISTNGGLSFHSERIYEFPDYPDNNHGFNTIDTNLTALADAKGIDLTSKTVLRFQQYGIYDFDPTFGNADGIALDNFCVSGIVIPPSASEEAVSPLSLNIFPNPAQNTLRLQWKAEQSSDLMVRVFDLTGRTVSSRFYEAGGASGEMELDVSMLPAAAYLLHVQTNQGQASQFFIKEN